MMTLIEQVRFNVEWELRNHHTKLDAKEIINRMTPHELLKAISKALEDLKENGEG